MTAMHSQSRERSWTFIKAVSIRGEIVSFSNVITHYFDMPRPIPTIHLDRIQATTRDLAVLLGISLPEPDKQPNRFMPVVVPPSHTLNAQ
jgi:hypothetical protein